GSTFTAVSPASTASPIVITGLTNGTTYSVQIKAVNANGDGTATATTTGTPKASQTITFSNPGAQNFGTSPTLTATASSGQSVTFTSATTGVCTITGGGALTFVTAGTCTINADQIGDASYLAASQVQQSFTVNAVAPGAPTIGTATAGDTQATVTFSAPASNGGSAITGYTVTSSGGQTASASSSPITVTGLTNGTAYTFTVKATNGTTGAASAASNSVTPAASQTITFNNPGAQNFGTTPTLSATASSSLTVAFTSATTGVCTVTSGGALTFLTTGTCTINANQAGDGSHLAASQVSQSFSVNAVVPGAPTIGTASPGDTQATVSFTAPAFTGGAAITGYTVTSNPGGVTGTGSASPITVTGLTNGVPYTFTVKATNAAGDSLPSSPSNSVTPNPGPAVVSVAVPANGRYKAGGNLDFTVSWDQNTTVTGTPRIALVIGATTVYANYVSSPSATTSLFRYTVLAGQTDTDGITVGALSLNGGTIRNGSSVDATLTLNSVGSTASILVDTTAPTLPAANIVVNNQADPHKVVLTFSEALDGATLGATSAWTAAANGGSPAYTVASVALTASTQVTLTLAAVDLADSKTFILNNDANGHLKITPPATLADLAGNTYAAGLVTEAGATPVLDSTAPTLSAVSTSAPSSSGGSLAATASEKTMAYWIAVPHGAAAPSVAQVKAGTNYGAVTVASHGSGALPSGTAGSLSLSGLAASTPYDIYVSAEDAAGNPTAAVSSASLTTAAAPSGSSLNTLPSGGGSATPAAGSTVTVTDNGSNGSTINLPPPPSSGSGSTTPNTVNLSLPVTGTITVSSDTGNTQLGIQHVTLPGSTQPVTTVTVNSGSATLTATQTGQPVVSLKNGIVVVSGSDHSRVDIDTTGAAAQIAVQNSDTIVVPTGSPNVAGTTVNLPTPSTTGGSTAAVTVQVGSQTLSIQSSQSGTSMTFQVVDIGGTPTPVLAVSGTAQISTSGENQPLMAVGNGNHVLRSGNGGGQTCNTQIQATHDANNESVHINTCFIVLEAGSFSSARMGRLSSINGVNHFASIKDGVMWAGETADFDSNGQVSAAYLGSHQGDTPAVGDNMLKGSGSFKVDSLIPRLGGKVLRLGGADLNASLFSVMGKAFGTTIPAPQQNADGTLVFTIGGKTYSTLPSGRVWIDTSQPDGVAVGPEGVMLLASGGYVMMLVPSVTEPTQFAGKLAAALPVSTTYLRWNGTYLVTTADGSTYVARPAWTIAPTQASIPAFSSASQDIVYNDGLNSQTLVPDFGDYNSLENTFRTEFNDPSLTVLPKMDGTAVLTTKGKTYLLVPNWQLIQPADLASRPAWWVDNGVIYIKNANNTAQGFTVKQ
ncbi:MAG: beta strand repeat-containing protein, partial [Burkholderiales bacterium]